VIHNDTDQQNIKDITIIGETDRTTKITMLIEHFATANLRKKKEFWTDTHTHTQAVL
jgi:hypothetical protein